MGTPVRYWDKSLSAEDLRNLVLTKRLDINAAHDSNVTVFEFMCGQTSIEKLYALLADKSVQPRALTAGGYDVYNCLAIPRVIRRYDLVTSDADNLLIHIATMSVPPHSYGLLLYEACLIGRVDLARRLILEFNAHVDPHNTHHFYHALIRCCQPTHVLSIAWLLYDNGYRFTGRTKKYPVRLALEAAVESSPDNPMAAFLAPFASLACIQLNRGAYDPNTETLVLLMERCGPMWVSYFTDGVKFRHANKQIASVLYSVRCPNKANPPLKAALTIPVLRYCRRVIVVLLQHGEEPIEEIRAICPDALLPWTPQEHRRLYSTVFDKNIQNLLTVIRCIDPSLYELPLELVYRIISFMSRRLFDT